ncbi:sugar transferase [Tengunoibacter tsumagoiensis]|uniref:Bacterial sugar transferase domain-containing protein n=1 Tax=Tengunoibacter tsumagoiensis TaxID=2014871 RepID=A0A401ZUF6_9CHLR|nr:sugar transferase [Tengunoibacter tsumagoiensis]GCE10503.1 hypothetical protein KTT_03620 [Tengunoibacter tsumagoiensis]
MSSSSSMNNARRLNTEDVRQAILEKEEAPHVLADLLPIQRIVRRPWSYRFSKRCLDICGALLGLITLGACFPVIAWKIYQEDHGPIFYSQKRIGRDGRPFLAHKFRSMVVNADTLLVQQTELWEEWQRHGKLRHDPRVTRFGAFLRKTSLDELPQMLNVLRGEMSLVGPRAIQSSEIKSFGELYELYHAVKPGLTGLWQISGRSQINYEQRSLLDCIYILERSFCNDLFILFLTITVVFHGEGAY